ncbi:MAG: peptidylprolyl isomerase [Magnetospirillum sp. WYHS-4]
MAFHRLRPFSIILALVLSMPASAQESLRIAAIVNDEIISVYDLNARVRLIIGSSNLPDTQEVRTRLTPQALRSLIDDRLRLQEAKKIGIIVPEEDLARALKDLERQNGLPPDSLGRFLESKGIDKAALVTQVEAEIAWSRVIRNRITPRIQIGEDEIQAGLERYEAAKSKPQYLVSEIFLPVDTPADEEEANSQAARLFQELKQGASFPALARNFSKGPTSEQGGSLGWVREGQLAPELDAMIKKMEPGELSAAIRSLTGVHLLMVRERRIGGGPAKSPEETRAESAPAPAPVASAGTTVQLSQLVLPLPESAKPADVAAAGDRARTLAAPAKTCQELEAIGRKISPLSGPLGTLKLKDLPADLQKTISGLKVNQMAPPRRTVDGVGVLMLCDRRDTGAPAAAPPPQPAPPAAVQAPGKPPAAPDKAAEREAVRNSLMNERLTAQARRYLRDLRRSAVVDMRQ